MIIFKKKKKSRMPRMLLVQTKDKIKKDGGREGAEGTMKTVLHVPQSVCCGMGGDGRGGRGHA
jgi:hypothetical protein